MSRPLHVFHAVDTVAEGLDVAFEQDPGLWLPDARRVALAAWRVLLHYHAFARPVRCEVGDPWHVGSTVWRSVRWVPLAQPDEQLRVERMLPTFTGELGLYHGGAPSLVLAGDYDVPLPAAGELADGVILHRVARRTAVVFLDAVAHRLVTLRAAEATRQT